jgi:hypothetical protein
MSRYECCFLDENDKVVRIEILGSCDDGDAHREAMPYGEDWTLLWLRIVG